MRPAVELLLVVLALLAGCAVGLALIGAAAAVALAVLT